MVQILVSNPTRYTRRETVQFGCPLDVTEGEILHVTPGAQVRTAVVEVAPFASGYQELVEVEPHDCGGVPSMELTYFEDGKPYPFAFEEALAGNDQLSVNVFKALAPGSVGRLVLYTTPGEPWARYSFMSTIVSLNVAEVAKAIGFEIDSGPGGVTYDRLRGTDTKRWYSVENASQEEDGLLRDATSVVSEGVHLQGTMIAAAEDPELLSTALALAAWDLVTAGDWRAGWGPWNTIPQGSHSDRSTSFGMRDHLGVILLKGPGTTGDQFGFGFWKHLDVIEKGNGFALDHDRWAVGKEACRPIFWLDADGGWPKKSEHPRFKSWSEKPHWHTGVSPDQFRRIGTVAHYVGWVGMDEEHMTCSYLKEDFFLRGSFLTLLLLRQKAFMLKTQGRWSGTGRALGRTGLTAWDCYQATGDEELLHDMKNRLVPRIKKNWEDINGTKIADIPLNPTALDRPWATRIIYDDPHTGIPGAEWVVWEDAITVPALDKLSELFADPELALLTYLLGASICQFGINNGEGGDGKILKAIKWNGGAPVGPMKASSRQTNYHAWGYGAWAVTARVALSFGDTPMAGRAAKLGAPVREGNYGNKWSYLAPAP